jgi:3-dehydroquinate synthase
METKIVTVDLGARSYDVYIGSGLLYRLADFVPMDITGRNAYVITDIHVDQYAARIRDILFSAGAARVEILKLPPGEQTKSFKMAERVSNWLLDHNVSRDSIIFAVGGGVVGDLTGFCASMILRGVPYVQVPTTLLAQVDSSVGGKTAVNAPQGKNLVGTFYQPAAVIADIETLETLPRRELVAGYAEVVKYGLINDMAFFNWLETNGRNVLALDADAAAYAVEASIKAKAAIVQADETEKGQRALLNLGHTFAHALEAAAGYDGRLLHGEAVAIGIVMAFDMSMRMGLCDKSDCERIEEHFKIVGLPTRVSLIQPALETSAQRLFEIMGRDKKVSGGKMRFIAANGIGECFINEDVPEHIVREVLKYSLGESGGGMAKSFARKGIKGLWKSAFSSLS